MTLFLTGTSAVEYLALHPVSSCRPRAFAQAFKSSVPSRAGVDAATHGELDGLSQPLHLLVPCPSSRRILAGAQCHVWGAPLPRRAFYQLGTGSDIYVGTAEFSFVQAAGSLDLVSLIRLGCELCGSYGLSPRDPRGFVDREPLCDAARLRRMAAGISGYCGRTRAMRAARYVIDGSASPMETVLVLLLCLPLRLGGYGLPRPAMNRRVDVPGHLAWQVSSSYFCCDLYWESARLAVEYDSDSYHTGPERIFRDARRRGELSLLGVDVMTVTRAQVRNAIEFDKVAHAIAARLRHRLRLDRMVDWHARNRDLRARLLLSSREEFAARNADREYAVGESWRG